MATKTKSGMLALLQGFKLVALAGPDTGLYRKGDEFAVYADEALGDVEEIPEGRSYPDSPSGKRWRWLFSKGGTGDRIAQRVNGKVVSVNGNGAEPKAPAAARKRAPKAPAADEEPEILE